ncbi:hypothetical protein FVF58_01125 [Paraburkholderia panacisoli]|uniref:Uncharacterized protein n=1 Tax=Paraburkholderia panacisoli TaxID=2603818 RepID=A0A5B0HMH2_9BURK|nr:hypothetical protein [Paraburkholderia panacisoli]KAA1015983.1 hypothetical protein FVF58_01125 [Paraburkholderia panacisoli]
MAWADILPVLERVAPTIATVAGTPLLGGAVAALEVAFGLTPKPDTSLDARQDAVAHAVSGSTPEQLAAIRKADQDYATRMAEAGFKDKETIAQLALAETQTYVSDTQDARRANAANVRVFWLGIVVLCTFATMSVGSLYGAYALLTGAMPLKDAALVGMVAGFVGTIIGYVAANATQVISFYFGSSKGSEQKSEAMATAFTQAFGGNPAPVTAKVATAG